MRMVSSRHPSAKELAESVPSGEIRKKPMGHAVVDHANAKQRGKSCRRITNGHAVPFLEEYL